MIMARRIFCDGLLRAWQPGRVKHLAGIAQEKELSKPVNVTLHGFKT
jgi:hypothetical protein